MPGTSRVVLPEHPHHIIQRGHNRQVVFASDKDYIYYLEDLKEWKKTLQKRLVDGLNIRGRGGQKKK